MKIAPNSVSFKGKYLLVGDENTLKEAKKNIKRATQNYCEVNIIDETKTPQGVLILTNEDKATLNKKLNNNGFLFSIKNSCNNVVKTCCAFLKKIFGNDKNTRLIEAKDFVEEFNFQSRQGLPKPSLKNEGKMPKESIFVDGSKETYSKDGKLISKIITLKDGTIESYEHGRILVSRILPNGIKEKYDFDGNLITKIFPDGTKENYLYNKDGSQILNSSKEGYFYLTEFSAKPIVKLVKQNDSKTIYFKDKTSLTYDLEGNLISKTLLDGTIENYSPNGKLIFKITKENGQKATHIYRTNGFLKSIIYEDGTTEEYRRGILKTRHLPNGNMEVFSSNGKLICTLDQNCNIIKETNK